MQDESDIRLEDRKLARISRQLRDLMTSWSKSLSDAEPSGPSTQIKNLQKQVGLPLMLLAMPFSQEGDQSHTWAMLIVWHDRIVASLPAASRQARTALLDSEGNVIAGFFPTGEAAAASAEWRLILAQSSTRTMSTGTRSWKDIGGVPRQVAFSKLPRHGLTVAVSRDARLSDGALNNIILGTLQWAWVIFLGAIFVSYLAVAGVTRSLKRVTETTLKIAGGNFSTRLPRGRDDEVGMLSLAINHMSEQIILLLRRAVVGARQEKELETAKTVQDMFYPPRSIKDRGIAIHGTWQVASECGGDWWWHFRTDDEKHFVIVADVTGHGAPAALVTAMVHACCATLRRKFAEASGHADSIGGFMREINQMLWISGTGKTTMTALIALFDPKIGKVTYGSAGHTKPYLIRRDQDALSDGEKQVRVLSVRGAPLGIAEEAEFSEQTLDLRRGDSLIFFTDGLIECTNAQGKRWSKRRLETLLKDMISHDITTIVDSINTCAFAHFDGHPVEDDITVIGIQMADIEEAKVAA
jgi:sigma-B regulation protein RsbU (phosphoserine phosphatase)